MAENEEKNGITFDRIEDVDLKKKMEENYIDYAMSVIASRAIPDVRDGLKPVQRRILFSMTELNNTPDKPHRKCARIVGDTMGKYHPHGDSSIYGALVNMAQDWNTRYPLVDGHGNFGSVDGDGAAAMRYTEARLSKISMEMLADINKDTVDFIPNFDETEKEPVVLPSRYPNLLVNGTNGIAVGMATNIPPHNLREVVSAVDLMIRNRTEEGRETEPEEIMKLVPAPDFPTGGIIMGTAGAQEAYRTGRGKVTVRAVTDMETMPNGKTRILVTELPYMVNKANLIRKIADLVKDKKIDGITDLRDETSREGMRVVIECRRDANPNIILNKLWKHTEMQSTFGIIMLALVNNEPKILTLKDTLTEYIRHQEDVVTRRTKFDLNKAEERDHILQGLLIALDNIDEVIRIIRSSSTPAEARQRLEERFGLSEKQSNAIVEMRLRALTGLEREKLEAEHEELLKKIAYFREILADNNKLLNVIKDEINVLAETFGDERRSRIGYYEGEIETEDLVPNENAVIAMTSLGYVKRMESSEFSAQHRGGRGVKGMTTIEDDYIEDLLMTGTHSYIMFCTDKGRAYRLKTYQIPEAGRAARGTAVVNLLNLQPDEKITAMIPITEYSETRNIFMVTKKGVVKKTPMSQFSRIMKNGLRMINLDEDDELIEVKSTDETEDIFIVTKNGMCMRFNEKEVRPMGRTARGVRGIRLKEGDEVIGVQITSQGSSLLIVSENGMGKRSALDQFTPHHRGGQGIMCYRITEKTGSVVGVKAVDDDHEIMIITTAGIIIQIRMGDIRVLSRGASGVKLIRLDKDVRVAKIAKVREEIEEEETAGDQASPEGEGEGQASDGSSPSADPNGGVN
ncbi:MAG: DNA gyrase subunit A [Lachnospiraceae bacterium]|nr:DNA gyrase subunit A [Lachnospiraceae bacterium]